jgi:hypothetical protein
MSEKFPVIFSAKRPNCYGTFDNSGDCELCMLGFRCKWYTKTGTLELKIVKASLGFENLKMKKIGSTIRVYNSTVEVLVGEIPRKAGSGRKHK